MAGMRTQAPHASATLYARAAGDNDGAHDLWGGLDPHGQALEDCAASPVVLSCWGPVTVVIAHRAIQDPQDDAGFRSWPAWRSRLRKSTAKPSASAS